MSLRIDIHTIAHLLLQDGMGYEVLPGSFTADSVEWTDSDGSRGTLVPTCTINGSEVLTKTKHELSLARNNAGQALSKVAYADWAHRS